jgi:hypothetical protein
MPTEHTPSRNEDEYFARESAQLIAERRAALDAERARREQEARQPRCPRCSTALEERELRQVKVDVCPTCGGVWLDKGELELLSAGERGSRRAFLGELFGIKD